MTRVTITPLSHVYLSAFSVGYATMGHLMLHLQRQASAGLLHHSLVSKLTQPDASQLLHELMHAIVYHRRLEKWGPKGLNLAEEAEPYIRDDQLFEAGISLERHLLGGSEVSAASFDFHKTPPGEAQQVKLCSFTLSSDEVPWSHRAYKRPPKDDQDWTFMNAPMKINHSWHVPAFYCALLFTDEYWDKVVAKKGRGALKPPTVSFSASEFQVKTGLTRSYDIEVSQRHGVDELQEPLDRVRNELRTRKQRMHQLRPWFDTEFPQWGTSVWGSSSLFRRLDSYREYDAVTNPIFLDINGGKSPPDDPIEYLQALEKHLFPTWRYHIDAGPREWTEALVDGYHDLLQQRKKPGQNPQKDWADFNFKIPPTAAMPTITSWTFLARLNFRLVNRPNPMEAIDPRLPKKPSRMREPDPRKPPETFLTANQVASRNFVLLFTGEGNTEVWDPTGLDVTFVNVTGDTVTVGTTFADQRQLIYNKTINGLVLEDDRNAMAVSFRRRLRDGRVRRRGRLMAMMTETEIRQMDGEYSTPLFKIWEDKVFNITEFLHTATEEEKDAVMSSVPGQPEHLDPSKLPQGSPILERLNRYLCAMVRPETCTSWNQVHNNPQLFTKDELRMHDNPDDGIYIAIEGVVYDITHYRQHHPAADTALAGLFGHDATEAFSKAHPNHFPNRDHQIYDHFPNYDFQVYGHTVRNVGRIVEEWDATTAIPANCVVLHGHALFLQGAKAHWGAADLTRQLTHPAAGADGAARARELQDYYDTNRFFYTRAKMVTPEAKDPLKKSIAFPELRRHQDYRAAQGKWVRDMGTDIIYDITCKWTNDPKSRFIYL
ncbi:hypothetical protein PG990_014242 [Apiospora arundinis]